MTTREFDVVVFGASGFVGRLIAAHLAEQAPQGTLIALAGRTPERLDEVRQGLPPAYRDISLLSADAGDQASLSALAKSARVVISTVGPYAQAGLGLVRACAEHGTHYLDLSGEVLFQRDSIQACDQAAQASGARIIHACGFDSVPSDLGVMLTAEKAKADGAGDLTQTVLNVRNVSGGYSGGTIASMKDQMVRAKDKEIARILVDPYALSPDRAAEPEPPGHINKVIIEISGRTRSWGAPFVMGAINEPVVRRSNALTGWSYGRCFRYREVTDTGTGRGGALTALAVANLLPAAGAAWRTPGLGGLLDKVLPKAGSGPSDKQLDAGRFKMEITAETTSGHAYATTVSAPYDPGYRGTAIMIGQAALALVAGDPELPERAGVLTPATALGHALVNRLRNHEFVLDSIRLP